MQDNETRIQALWEGWRNHQLNADELQELETLLQQPGSKQPFGDMLSLIWENMPAQGSDQRPETLRMIERIIASAPAEAETSSMPVHRVHFLKTAWFRYAAILLLIAGTAIYFYRINTAGKQTVYHKDTKRKPADIPPGGNKAILTLSNGSEIVLDAAAIGSLAQQGNTKIIKLNEGSLAYNTGSATSHEILYNTISTPKGGQYQVVLPDGTKVWLNAASSIRFPTVFLKDRTVEVTGELYLEVANDSKKPFLVNTGQTAIQVLGTSFNVNVYHDEPSAKVTLVEGAIKIANIRMQPGQAYLNGKIVATNLQRDLAWKNGAFSLDNKTLPELMRQIARWYDLEIAYEKPVRIRKFEGEIGMNLTLSQCLRALETMQVKCRLEGRKLTVMP